MPILVLAVRVQGEGVNDAPRLVQNIGQATHLQFAGFFLLHRDHSLAKIRY